MASDKYPFLAEEDREALIMLLGETRYRILCEIEKLDACWSLLPEPGTPLYGRDKETEPFKGWSIPRIEAMYLYGLLRMRRPRVVLEIGTSFGYSTLWLSAALESGDGHLHTCEAIPQKASIAQTFLRQAGAKNVTLHERKGLEVCRGWSDPLDLIFLDADIETYIDYYHMLAPHFQSNTVLLIDNAIDRRANLQPFINFLAGMGHDGWTVPVGHGLLHIPVRRSETGLKKE